MDLLNFTDSSVKKVKPTLEFMIQLADNESKFSKDELREHALTFITGVIINFFI